MVNAPNGVSQAEVVVPFTSPLTFALQPLYLTRKERYDVRSTSTTSLFATGQEIESFGMDANKSWAHWCVFLSL